MTALSVRCFAQLAHDGPCARQTPRVIAQSARAEAAVVAKQQLQLRISAKNIPHPGKAHYGGEDAHFVSAVGGGALGVADGVGGWNDSGISPAEYSRTFMETARKFMEGELGPDGGPAPALSTSEWLDARPGWDGLVTLDQSVDAAESADPAEPAAADAAAEAAAAAAEQGQNNADPDPRASFEVLGDAVAFELDDASVAQWLGDRQAGGNGQAAVNGNSNGTANGSPQLAWADLAHRTPQKALDIAHRLTRLPGSTTACILRLDGERGVLNAANLGDSGFLLLRGGQLFFQSPALQHFFDCPYQFGAFPEYAEATDSADDAAVYDFEVQPGDVVILGTDGLLDNCYTEEIVRLAPKSPAEVAQAAAALAELASQHANDPDFESPYTEEALQEGFDIPIWEKLSKLSVKGGKLSLGKLRGGKIDDITVVVAYVEAVAGEAA